MPRIIFIHGNHTMHWRGGWKGWLHDELESRGYQTSFETFPDSINARAKYWLPFLRDYLQAGVDDVLVGWSSGAVAAMRYAERQQVAGSVLISPCHTDLGDAFERRSGLYPKRWDWKAIKSNQARIDIIHGDHDPFIPRREFTYIAQRLEIAPVMIKDGGHFVDQETFPELLGLITDAYPAS